MKASAAELACENAFLRAITFCLANLNIDGYPESDFFDAVDEAMENLKTFEVTEGVLLHEDAEFPVSDREAMQNQVDTWKSQVETLRKANEVLEGRFREAVDLANQSTNDLNEERKRGNQLQLKLEEAGRRLRMNRIDDSGL